MKQCMSYKSEREMKNMKNALLAKHFEKQLKSGRGMMLTFLQKFQTVKSTSK